MKFKVGDYVQEKNDSSLRGVWAGNDVIEREDNEGWKGTPGVGVVSSSYKPKYRGTYWHVSEGNFELITKSNKIIMQNIVTFAKNLVLSADEKLLREMGLKNDCGDYTCDAEKLVMAKLLKDNEAYLIEIATAKKAEEKE